MRQSNPSNPNPPYGDKGQFRKLTVTVPPDVYERLIQESARRKIAGESNQLLSALLREALSDYLDRIAGDSARENTGTPHAA
jgi:transcriptional regulator of met regulon